MSRDKEHGDYFGAVSYAVWRSGGNVDAVDRDRVQDDWYNGQSVDDAADDELRRQRPQPCEEEQEYPSDDEEAADVAGGKHENQ